MKKYELIAIGIGSLFLLLFLTKIMQKFGLIKSKKRRNIEENVAKIRSTNYFNPTFYKSVGAYNPITQTEANIAAKELRKAMRGFGTDEEKIYSVFKNLKNKTNISQVAEAYFMRYKNDLKAVILNELNNKEKSILMGIIESLPYKI